VKIVGKIPSGLPSPTLPYATTQELIALLPGSLEVALVTKIEKIEM
jgi:MFS superfamily sulfate permease-like transporter